MKLSEAIEKGFVGKEQIKYQYISINEKFDIVAVCPIGAAWCSVAPDLRSVALYWINRHECDQELMLKEFPILSAHVDCPECENRREHKHHYYQNALAIMMMELNDVHSWGYQKIIDWVKKVEEAYEQT